MKVMKEISLKKEQCGDKRKTFVLSGILCISLLLGLFLLPDQLSASVADRAKVISSTAAGDYQIEVFTLPEVVEADKTVTITVKILDIPGLTPARNGKIFINTDSTVQDVTDYGVQYLGSEGYRQAKESDISGNYELAETFTKADAYFVKIKIDEIDGTKFNEPLVTGFALHVASSPNLPVRFTVMLTSLLFITLLGVYITSIKLRNSETGKSGFNLLDIQWVRRAFRFRYIQPLFQVPMIIFFSILIFLAFFDVQDGGKNLSTMTIWTIWWAGIIFTFVLVGRLWCFMCPVGALSEWTARIFKSDRPFPRRLRNLWIANAMFIILTWLDAQIGVVRSPLITGILLLIIVGISVVTALFYQRRTFCRYLCPIGGIIGLYSMFSAVELRSKDCTACRDHNRKDCYLGNENGRGCPMFEIVPAMDSNNYCNFCGECIKSCPKENITLRVRAFFKDAWTSSRQSLDQSALAVVLVGVSIFVTGDMLEPWEGWIRSAMDFFPAEFFGIRYEYTVELITKSVLYFSISLIIIPGMVLMAAFISNALVGRDNHQGLKQTFTLFGVMFIPLGLSMHLAHNTGHLLNESLAVVPAFQRTILEFTPFNFGIPEWQMANEFIVSPSVLYMLQMILLAIFYVVSLYTGYRLANKTYRSKDLAFKGLMPMLAVSFILMSVNVILLNMPMAPRHIH